MKYTITVTAYEMAMLDAACRACGLPLESALVVEANQQAPEAKAEPVSGMDVATVPTAQSTPASSDATEPGEQ